MQSVWKRPITTQVDVSMATPAQKRFWVFLKSLQSLFHINNWEDVFDFVTYNDDARVRGNEVKEWELLIQYINYPIYGVCRYVFRCLVSMTKKPMLTVLF